MDLLIDSHCHLDFPEFAEDRGEIWSRCQSLGVRIAIIPGVTPRASLLEYRNFLRHLFNSKAELTEQLLVDNAAKNADDTDFGSGLRDLGWYFTTGLHPWWIEKYFGGVDMLDTHCAELSVSGRSSNSSPDTSQSAVLLKLESRLRADLEAGVCIGLGESGLDFNIKTPRSIQLESLRVHLTLSAEKKLPVILHSVKAHAELIAAIKQFPGCRGVIHAFTGSYDIAAQYWQLGFALGVGGTITYERAKKTRDAFKRMPLDALVLETDAPDMPICGQQGKRNSPEYLPQIAQRLASLRGCSFEEVAQQTTKNSLKIFSINVA